MSKFVCPFCLKEYDRSEVLYWCPDCLQSSEPSFLEKALGKVVSCKRINPQTGKACGGKASIRKCKDDYCDAGSNGSDLIPKEALESPYFPFSIIGLTNSGKTNYITVMLHELGRVSGGGIIANPITSVSRKIQKEHYDEIYHRHRVPDATNDLREQPQIWQMKIPAKRTGNTVPTYVFTIYDGAGEKQTDIDPTQTEGRYISTSKALIITLDPLSLENVIYGSYVDKSIMRNSRNDSDYANSTEIVNTIVNYIKTASGIKGKKMLNMPVAIVLTKFDTILSYPSFESNALVRTPSTVLKNGKVNSGEIDQINDEIKDWLIEIGESSFIESLDANFSDYRFFGVSSYGGAPVNGQTPQNIRPHRVLDPLLWLFKKQGFID